MAEKHALPYGSKDGLKKMDGKAGPGGFTFSGVALAYELKLNGLPLFHKFRGKT